MNSSLPPNQNRQRRRRSASAGRMGLLTILKKQKEKEKEMRLLMLGLDNAGKTTIVKKFNGEDVDTIAPTLGFNIKTLECVPARPPQTAEAAGCPHARILRTHKPLRRAS